MTELHETLRAIDRMPSGLELDRFISKEASAEEALSPDLQIASVALIYPKWKAGLRKQADVAAAGAGLGDFKPGYANSAYGGIAGILGALLGGSIGGWRGAGVGGLLGLVLGYIGRSKGLKLDWLEENAVKPLQGMLSKTNPDAAKALAETHAAATQDQKNVQAMQDQAQGAAYAAQAQNQGQPAPAPQPATPANPDTDMAPPMDPRMTAAGQAAPKAQPQRTAAEASAAQRWNKPPVPAPVKPAAPAPAPQAKPAAPSPEAVKPAQPQVPAPAQPEAPAKTAEPAKQP